MNNIKVSVIVPVFNESSHISAALDSIINQNFDDYEIIVVDDGSTDNTLEIVRDKLENSKIPNKIIHQSNNGVSSARNRGIDEANGQYIAFVDGDDYILTNHLSELYSGVNDFSLIQLVKKEKDKISSPHYYHGDELSAKEFIKKELLMEIPFNFVQLLYKTDIIKKNNIRFDENIIYGEDLEFALKALSYGKTVKISNEITYFYIQHDSSAINTSKLKRFELIPVLENLADFYKKQGLDDLAHLIHTSRIPKAIFGNMNYFFYNNYDFDEITDKMDELDLFTKLSKFEGSKKFDLKIRLFLFNPKLYYKMWKKFKNSI